MHEDIREGCHLLAVLQQLSQVVGDGLSRGGRVIAHVARVLRGSCGGGWRLWRARRQVVEGENGFLNGLRRSDLGNVKMNCKTVYGTVLKPKKTLLKVREGPSVKHNVRDSG